MEQNDQNYGEHFSEQSTLSSSEVKGTRKYPRLMKILSFLFSFKGRVNRSTYLVLVIPMCFIQGLVFPFWIILALSSKRLHDLNKSGLWLLSIPIIFVIFSLPNMVYNSSPGQLIVLSFFPLYFAIGYVIWNFSKFLFYKGDAGKNRYGEPPISKIPIKFSITPNQIVGFACLVPVLYIIGMNFSNYEYVSSPYYTMLRDNDISNGVAKFLDPWCLFPYIKYFVFLCLFPFGAFYHGDRL
jgi:uncharacterized membrane protein YhaH (DUF805 family)